MNKHEAKQELADHHFQGGRGTVVNPWVDTSVVSSVIVFKRQPHNPFECDEPQWREEREEKLHDARTRWHARWLADRVEQAMTRRTAEAPSFVVRAGRGAWTRVLRAYAHQGVRMRKGARLSP